MQGYCFNNRTKDAYIDSFVSYGSNLQHLTSRLPHSTWSHLITIGASSSSFDSGLEACFGLPWILFSFAHPFCLFGQLYHSAGRHLQDEENTPRPTITFSGHQHNAFLPNPTLSSSLLLFQTLHLLQISVFQPVHSFQTILSHHLRPTYAKCPHNRADLG